MFGFEHLGAKLGALILSALYYESYEFAFAAFLVRPRKYLMIIFSLAPAPLNLLVSYFVYLDIPRLHL